MKKSFVSGAMVLMVSNAISKILGAVLKIPLTYIMHEEGMAVYNTAFSVYVMLLSFVISGIPFAAVKLSATALARGSEKNAKGVIVTAGVILTIIGAVCSVVLWFGADFFALAMKEPLSAIAIRAVAPSVLLVAIGDAAKSAFQGKQDMFPTAVSQCIESVIKLIAGYFLAAWLITRGSEYAAAGAAAGVTIGEAVATAILVLWYYISAKSVRTKGISRRRIAKDITDIAMPLFFMSVAGSALTLIDTSVLRASLLRSGLTQTEARHLYGAYTGYAMTVLNLPAGFLATLGVSIVPAISAAVAVSNRRRVRSLTRKGLIVAGVCGFCASAGIAIFGEFILQLLFHNTTSATMLRLCAPSVMFISVMQLSGAILQAMGYFGRAFISSLMVGVIKLLAALFLVSRPQINIYGAAIGADIAFFIGMMFDLLFIATCDPLKKENKSDIIK